MVKSVNKRLIYLGLGLVMSAVTVGAATGIKISAELRPQQIVKGERTHMQEVIIYEDNTFVPLDTLEAVADISVVYKDNILYLSDLDKEAIARSEVSKGTSKPTSIGDTQTVSVTNPADNYTANLTVQEVIRGDQAWEMVQAANRFNEAPGYGEEYLVVKMKAEIISSVNNKRARLNKSNFSVYDTNGKRYSTLIGVVSPEPALSRPLAVGEVVEGYMAFLIEKEDTQPTLAFDAYYDGTGGTWFKLQ